MAYNNNYTQTRGGSGYGSGSRPNNGNRPGFGGSAPVIEVPKAEALPADYVGQADKVIHTIQQQDAQNAITTTKLRNLFALFAETYNEVSHSDAAKLTKEQVQELTFSRVRIVYEIGRDRDKKRGGKSSVGEFAVKARLIQYLLDVGDDVEKFKAFYHYFEALVAYHRFYFGNNDKA